MLGVIAAFAAAAVAVALLPGFLAKPAPDPIVAAPTTTAAPRTVTPSASPSPAAWLKAENKLAGTTDWKMPSATLAGDRELAGFFSQPSALPGDKLQLFVQSGSAWTATAYRMGWYGGRGGRQVWASGRQKAVSQPAEKVSDQGEVYCPWKASLNLDTADWPEGGYLIVLRSAGKWKYIPLTLRSKTTADKLVLVHATTTYQAYNQWGGYSLYKGPNGTLATRAHRVSFHRPYDSTGAEKFVSFDMVVTQRAERLGLPLAWLTSYDLETPDILTDALGVVSLGHDEYVSVPMRDALESARDAGTNLAFLGGNAVYWRIRFADDGQTVISYKDAALDPVQGPTTTTLWRRDPDAKPESALTGMLYECYPSRGAFVVGDASFFLFDGTGARKGSSYAGINSAETDRVYPGDHTPKTLQVVAHSPVQCAQKPAQTYADMTYYTVKSGAGVVSTGSMAWVWAVRGKSTKWGIPAESVTFARKVTDNLLKAMAAGPLGEKQASKPNVDEINPNPSSQTGTGGTVSDDDE